MIFGKVDYVNADSNISVVLALIKLHVGSVVIILEKVKLLLR